MLLALTTGAIGLTWIAAAVSLVGCGMVILERLPAEGQDRAQSAENWFNAFWLGFVLLLLWLQLWHLVLPVSALAWLPVAGLAATGFWQHRGRVRLLLARMRQSWRFCLLLVVVLAWVARYAMDFPRILDTGLYHLPLVEWMRAYPIVPGLGNLHGRLAFNNANFLYVAALEVGPWIGFAHYLASGLPLVVLAGEALVRLRRVWQPGALPSRVPSRADVAGAFLLIPLIFQMRFASSPSPDVIIFALGSVLALRWLSLLDARAAGEPLRPRLLFLVTVLAAGGITVKLSFAAFGGSLVLLVWWLFWRQYRHSPQWWRVPGWAAIVASLLAVVWVVRGVILSGYVAYPATIGALPVDWRVPVEAAVAEANAVYGWARQPDQGWPDTLESWDWVGPWLVRNQRNPDFSGPVALLLLAAAAALLVSLARRRQPVNRLHHGLWLFFLPLLIALLFWFITAPDPRFASAILWMSGIVVLVLALSRVAGPGSVAAVLRLSVGAGAVLWLLFVALSMIPLLTGAIQGLPPVPQPVTRLFEADGGLVIHVPVASEQGLCWRGALLCTPRPNALLQLRQDGDVRTGFMVAGE